MQLESLTWFMSGTTYQRWNFQKIPNTYCILNIDVLSMIITTSHEQVDATNRRSSHIALTDQAGRCRRPEWWCPWRRRAGWRCRCCRPCRTRESSSPWWRWVRWSPHVMSRRCSTRNSPRTNCTGRTGNGDRFVSNFRVGSGMKRLDVNFKGWWY